MGKPRLTKRQAAKLFKGCNALARALGISKGAVGNWPWDEPIPENHDLKIRHELKPEAFPQRA